MIFTSESVTPGHPDKLCDQISDACVDAFLDQDRQAHIAVECAIATGVVFIAANFAADAVVDLPSVCRAVMVEAGYGGAQHDARAFSVLTSLADLGREDPRGPRLQEGFAREHVNAFGFACRETASLMPAPIVMAHILARNLAKVQARRDDLLAPDGKVQVAVEYDGHTPVRLSAITVMSALAPPDGAAPGAIEALVRDEVIAAASETLELRPDQETRILVNPAGLYVRGGPAHHAGLTGRKVGIDTYGDYVRQSGSALSGKDPSRVDRVGTYAARWAAKNIVASGLAERCEVHVAYAPGEPKPVSVSVSTFGTGHITDEAIAARLTCAFGFSPAEIAERFALRGNGGPRPVRMRDLSVFGQIGREDLAAPWERLDLARDLA